MIKLRSLVILTMVLLSVCCVGGQTERKLAAADSLIYSIPDSALKILQSIDNPHKLSLDERAYYTVLITEAEYRNYLPLASDEALEEAYDYYWGQNDLYMMGRTLYCLGVVHMELDKPFVALEDFKQAEPLIASADDKRRLALINSNIGHVYRTNYYYQNSISRYNTAVELYRSIGDSINLCRVYGLMSVSYRGLADLDSAAYCNDAALSIAQSCNYELVVKQSKLFRACITREVGKIDSAKYYLNDYLSYVNGQINDDVHLLRASIAVDDRKYDSALMYLSMMSVDVLSLYELRSRINFKLGNVEAAIDDYQMYRRGIDQIWNTREQARIDEIEVRYDNRRHIEEKEHLRQSLIWWSVVSALCVALLGVIIVSIRLHYKKRERAYLDTIESLKNQKPDNTLLEVLGNRQNKLREAIESRLSIVGELITLSYEHKNNSQVFTAKFNELVTQNPLDSCMLSDIVEVVNNGYNGLIDYLTAEFELSTIEQVVAALSCVGFSSHQLYIILGCRSVGKVYYYKNRINSKLKVKGDLRDNLVEISQRLSRTPYMPNSPSKIF